MDLVASQRGQKSYFNSYILQRISQNKNFLGLITGPTGSGKSYSALRLGESLDTDFDIQNVCFTPREFMSLINGKSKKLKRGSVIVFDEIQVSMSHLEYHALQSKVLNYCFQTFRHRNFILFMTSPHLSFINASLRKLFHGRLETRSINVAKKQVIIKPLLLQCNQRTGVTYEKYLRVCTKEGVLPLMSIAVNLPSTALLAQYEAKKDQFGKDLNESISRDIAAIDDKAKRTGKPLTIIQQEILDYLSQRLTIPQIASEMDNSVTYIYAQLELIKKKGVTVRPVKEGAKILYYTGF